MELLDTLHKKASLCGPTCAPTHQVVKAQSSVSDQVSTFFGNLFSTADWPPRWHCGSWSDFHGWLYIVSDLGIWAAYFAIPILLLKLLRKKKDIPFHKIFLLFVAFILLCGLTHFVDATIFWWPAYRLSALLRFFTAVVSIITVYALYKVLPVVFTLRSVSELEAEIEKRRIVEEKLAASEFLLSEAGRISRVGGWEADLVNDRRVWSKTVYDILELPHDYALDSFELKNFFSEPYAGQMETAINDATNNGNRWDIELQITTKDSGVRWVRSTGEPVYDDEGKLIKLRGIFMDIDRYKTNELALNRSLELTTQNNQQLKNFTHILSHNIRNHASNIALISSLVNVDQLDDDNAELFEKMKNVSVALNTTLDDLSQAIKIKNNVISSEKLDVRLITDQVLEIFESDIKLNKGTVELDYQIESINFPRIYLESILINLISNAIKYRRPEVKLNIVLKTYKGINGETVLQCSDNGLGIDLKLHSKKIFGLYKTFHDRKDAHGVGLFLVKTQVESQGGRIEVDSTPGEGTTFKIFFNE